MAKSDLSIRDEKKPDYKIGRYRVIRELGRGGMGVVYLAYDPFIDRQVAIKTTLAPPSKESPEYAKFKRRFFNEAKAVGKLIHSGIVSLYDTIIEDDLFYLVMEYVDGDTLLKNCEKENLLPVNKAVNYIYRCAKALHYAHENGVIHRDIKPGNIIISPEDRIKISDFGIAKIEGDSKRLWSGRLPSSVHYTPPERIHDKPLTHQSDIFSLGVLMYELLTGTKPFTADTDFGIFFKILNETPKFLPESKRKIPEFLQDITLRALEKNLKNRYQTTLELASELSSCFDHLKYFEEEINYGKKLNILKQVEFFKNFLPAELAEVVRAARLVIRDPGSIVINEGEIEDCFYIIGKGELLVLKGDKALATLKRGECFGEMAYLGKMQRTATIKTIGKSYLIKFNPSAIENMSIRTQLSFHKVFNGTLISRLNKTSYKLSSGPS